MIYYNFTLKLENPQNLEVDVDAFFGDVFKTKTYSFDENSTITFIAGVYHNEKEFKFAKEKKSFLFFNKPKSISIFMFWRVIRFLVSLIISTY